jgi:Leucine-rich repeat (LRR) protein
LIIVGIVQTNITGPAISELMHLPRLTQLYLYENLLTGIIPPSIGALSELQILELHANALTGTIPSELFMLTNLDMFTAYDNNLTGSFPCADYVEQCLVAPCNHTEQNECRLLE